MQAQRKKIVVLGTGGTIAGMAPSALDSRNYVAAQRAVGDLLAGLPPPPGYELLIEQVAQIDSKDMGLAEWQKLLQRCDYWLAQPEVQGLLITHGTDTLEETAYVLQSVLAPKRPVVLTCAMRPASALDADGPQNLLDAMAVATSEGARGVVVVAAGRIHDAQAVQKVHTWRLDAFSSGDAGAIGQIRNGVLTRWRDWPQWSTPGAGLLQRVLSARDLPRVEIVFSHALANAATVDAWLDPDLSRRHGVPPLRGVVVAGTGGGTVHRELEPALRRALGAGVRVVRTSRCVDGLLAAREDDEFALAAGLSPVKARLALMLELLA